MWSISLIYIFLIQIVIKYHFCYALFINLNFDGHGPITSIQHLVWTSSHASKLYVWWYERHTIKHKNIKIQFCLIPNHPKYSDHLFITKIKTSQVQLMEFVIYIWFIFDVIVIFKNCSLPYSAWYKCKISFHTKIICFRKRVTVYN